jgi:hypothetical protein
MELTDSMFVYNNTIIHTTTRYATVDPPQAGWYQANNGCSDSMYRNNILITVVTARARRSSTTADTRSSTLTITLGIKPAFQLAGWKFCRSPPLMDTGDDASI